MALISEVENEIIDLRSIDEGLALFTSWQREGYIVTSDQSFVDVLEETDTMMQRRGGLAPMLGRLSVSLSGIASSQSHVFGTVDLVPYFTPSRTHPGRFVINQEALDIRGRSIQAENAADLIVNTFRHSLGAAADGFVSVSGDSDYPHLAYTNPSHAQWNAADMTKMNLTHPTTSNISFQYSYTKRNVLMATQENLEYDFEFTGPRRPPSATSTNDMVYVNANILGEGIAAAVKSSNHVREHADRFSNQKLYLQDKTFVGELRSKKAHLLSLTHGRGITSGANELGDGDAPSYNGKHFRYSGSFVESLTWMSFDPDDGRERAHTIPTKIVVAISSVEDVSTSLIEATAEAILSASQLHWRQDMLPNPRQVTDVTLHKVITVTPLDYPFPHYTEGTGAVLPDYVTSAGRTSDAVRVYGLDGAESLSNKAFELILTDALRATNPWTNVRHSAMGGRPYDTFEANKLGFDFEHVELLKKQQPVLYGDIYRMGLRLINTTGIYGAYKDLPTPEEREKAVRTHIAQRLGPSFTHNEILRLPEDFANPIRAKTFSVDDFIVRNTLSRLFIAKPSGAREFFRLNKHRKKPYYLPPSFTGDNTKFYLPNEILLGIFKQHFTLRKGGALENVSKFSGKGGASLVEQTGARAKIIFSDQPVRTRLQYVSYAPMIRLDANQSQQAVGSLPMVMMADGYMYTPLAIIEDVVQMMSDSKSGLDEFVVCYHPQFIMGIMYTRSYIGGAPTVEVYISDQARASRLLPTGHSKKQMKGVSAPGATNAIRNYATVINSGTQEWFSGHDSVNVNQFGYLGAYLDTLRTADYGMS